jgi:2-keto-4-pentenoate hydratase/2-oxohepta-3-ene-1,7-dioic acid hydratase in catechol pathway
MSLSRFINIVEALSFADTSRSRYKPRMQYGRVITTTGKIPFARVADTKAHILTAAPWDGGMETGEIDSAPQFFAPVEPSKILCVGRNYAAHAKELGNEVPKEPLLFLKPPSSISRSNGTVLLPPESTRVEHEVELALVVGKTCRRVSEEDALAHIFGYTCAGDISARDLQRSDGQWSRAKGFDTFCPVGPFIETDMRALAEGVNIACSVNGVERQRGNTRAMVFSLAKLVSYMSHAMTLEKGDLLLTGTPEGVGPLVSGDQVEMTLDGLPSLKFSVLTMPV